MENRVELSGYHCISSVDSSCVDTCSCSLETTQPVCTDDASVLFPTPCHAGCSALPVNKVRARLLQIGQSDQIVHTEFCINTCNFSRLGGVSLHGKHCVMRTHHLITRYLKVEWTSLPRRYIYCVKCIASSPVTSRWSFLHGKLCAKRIVWNRL